MCSYVFLSVARIVRVCVYVYVCECVYKHMYRCNIYTHTCVHMYVLARTCIFSDVHTYDHIYIHTYIYIYIYDIHTYVHTFHMYIHIFIRTYIHIYLHIYKQIYISI
jgi:pyridoxine kinase